MTKINRKECLYVALFALALILISVFSTKVGFHDSGEYITIAKYFAGMHNIDLFSTHSLLYPLIISPFLMIWPSLTMLKLVNVMWIFLIGLALFVWSKDKKAFLIFAFSPLAWLVSIQTTPILPASFFFLMAYIFMKKEKIKGNLLYSGIFLGLSCAVYDPMIVVSVIFAISFLWKMPVSKLIKYFIAMVIGFLPRMILDYALFKMPFYSLIRYMGTNFVIALGLNKIASNLQILREPIGILIVIAISPLLFKIYKLKWKEYTKEIAVIILAGLFFLIRAASLKYFLIFSPIIIIMLGSVLNKKEIKWHCILSIPLIIGLILAYGFFSANETMIQKDLSNIVSDYNVNYIIAEPYQAPFIAGFLWQNKPYVAWFEDYNASMNNKTRIRGYDFNFNSNIPLKDKLEISASFVRFDDNKAYDNYIIVSREKEMDGFKLDKCYELLCVFK